MVVVLVIEYVVLADCLCCALASVSGHMDLLKDLTSQIMGIGSEVGCFEEGLAVMVTSGFPPLPVPPLTDKSPSASLDFAFLLAVARTSAMLLLKVRGMAPEPDESPLFLNN